MMTPLSSFADRCRGALLGTAFGDMLGAPVEGWSAPDVRSVYGEPPAADLLLAASAGRYTDDTQMTLATLRSLIRCGKVDAADCARACAAAFDPARRYGRSATAVLMAIRQGVDPRQTARMLFPQGSWGNGAAMRSAPIGLYGGHLPVDDLRALVADAVCCTHQHTEALDAALAQARIIGRFSRLAAGQAVDGASVLVELSNSCIDSRMTAALLEASRLLHAAAPVHAASEVLGCGVRSAESVPLALYAALRHLDAPSFAVLSTIACGNDTDTLAAMTGAVVGARYGAGCFPAEWHLALERGVDGYDALTSGADELAAQVSKAGLFVDFYRGMG